MHRRLDTHYQVSKLENWTDDKIPLRLLSCSTAAFETIQKTAKFWDIKKIPKEIELSLVILHGMQKKGDAFKEAKKDSLIYF
jgi:hypothetical protein